MKPIFVDTWAWYALSDRGDTDHEVAQIANEELLDAGYTFITTNFVVDETVTLIRYNLGHYSTLQLGNVLNQLIAAELVVLIRIQEVHEKTAWQILEKYADQTFSFTDCTSFAVMQQHDLTHVFTADQYFATMGFVLVP